MPQNIIILRGGPYEKDQQLLRIFQTFDRHSKLIIFCSTKRMWPPQLFHPLWAKTIACHAMPCPVMSCPVLC